MNSTVRVLLHETSTHCSRDTRRVLFYFWIKAGQKSEGGLEQARKYGSIDCFFGEQVTLLGLQGERRECYKKKKM